MVSKGAKRSPEWRNRQQFGKYFRRT